MPIYGLYRHLLSNLDPSVGGKSGNLQVDPRDKASTKAVRNRLGASAGFTRVWASLIQGQIYNPEFAGDSELMVQKSGIHQFKVGS